MGYPEQLKEYFSDGGTLGALAKVSHPDIENMYAHAYELLEAGNGFQAGAMFTALTWLDHHEGEYWLGLSMARQLIGQHTKALASLSSALRCLGPDKPFDTRALRLMSSSLTILGKDDMAGRAAELATQMESLEVSVSAA
ncbi:hypothetical protein [Paraburkholderia sediminicola]|uniref:hypothetical protein n=1 Tax=Paraburkholderia sediminicola TaxID=458836 RepID=UPI0038B6C7A4